MTKTDKLMYFPEKTELIQHINKLLRKHKIRQQEIADISRVPQSTISHIIGRNKKRRPSELTYEQAQKIYNAILQIISPFGDDPVSKIATKSEDVERIGTVDSEATVREVAALMVKQGFTQLLVKNKDGVEGVITDLILLNQMLSPKDVDRDWLRELKEKPVRYYAEKPSIIPEQAKQAEAAQVLNYHYAVLIDEGKRRYGITTRNDFMKLLM